MGYMRAEMETTCVYDHELGEWLVYTCVPTHITKLNKIAAPIWKEEEPDVNGNPRMIAGKWKLGSKGVRFSKPRSMSEEKKKALAERMRNQRMTN